MNTTASKERIEGLIREWKAHPPLSGSFPVVIPNGGRIDGFSGDCSNCNGAIEHADLHGFVAFPIPTVATISAVGVCRKCSCLTPFQHRVRAVDGGLQSEWVNRAGQWVKRRWNKEPGHGMFSGWRRGLLEWLKTRTKDAGEKR